MQPGRRISLDSANMRGRLRGYTPRPIPGIQKRHLSPINKIEGIRVKPLVKVATAPKPNLIAEIKPAPARPLNQVQLMRPTPQAPVKPLSPELRVKAEQLIAEMAAAERAQLPVSYEPEEYATFPIPVAKSRITEIKDKAYAIKSTVNMGYVLTGAAVLFIIVGSALGVKGFKSNQKVEAQVKALSSTSYNGAENSPSDSTAYDETKPPPAASDSYAVAPSLPRFINIPSIMISGRVRRVTLNNNNTLEAPRNIYDAGWYDGSAKPGEDGAVFIDGHVSGPTQHGIFYYLHKLKIGETVTIERGDGKKLNYKVVAAELFDADKVDMAKALKPYDGAKEGLNLMTCGGKFIPAKQEYDKRLVVYTVLQ